MSSNRPSSDAFFIYEFRCEFGLFYNYESRCEFGLFCNYESGCEFGSFYAWRNVRRLLVNRYNKSTGLVNTRRDEFWGEFFGVGGGWGRRGGCWALVARSW